MIYVISCGIKKDNLSTNALEIANNSDTIIGSKRLLEFFEYESKEKVILNSELIRNLKKFIEENNDKDLVFLASGDSLFHGIGEKLSNIVDRNSLTLIPNITVFQEMFSRLHISWNDAKFYSVHGTEKLIPVHSVLSDKISVIYCDDKMTAAQAAGRIVDIYSGASYRSAVIAENLGNADELLTHGTLKELSEIQCSSLSILLILPEAKEKVSDPGLPTGIDDSEYEKESNCITHSEVRAIALSKLKIGPGIMWDLGAGSGSVGIEAAMNNSCMQVYSVERIKRRIELAEKNRIKFGCRNLKLIESPILDCIEELPSPRSVFVGGGGDEISEIVNKTYERILPGGRIVVTAVLLETVNELLNTLQESCIEVITISINRSTPIKNKMLMKADNTITMFIYEKPYET